MLGKVLLTVVCVLLLVFIILLFCLVSKIKHSSERVVCKVMDKCTSRLPGICEVCQNNTYKEPAKGSYYTPRD